MVIIILGISLSFSLFIYLNKNEQKKAEYALQLAADERLHAINAEGDILNKVLQGLRGLYTALDNVNAHEFATFSHNMALQHDYIKAVSWLPQKPGSPPSYPVKFVEPETFPASLSGMDFDANRQLAGHLQQLRADNRIVIIPDNYNIADDDTQSLNLLLPIYKRGRQQLWGFLMLRLDFHLFIDTALAHRVTGDRQLDIFIIDSAKDNKLLFYQPADENNQASSPKSLAELETVTYHRPLQILDQGWKLYIKPLNSNFPAEMALIPWFTLLASMTITFLIAGFINANMDRRNYAEALVADRTRALRKSEERLTELYNIISSDRRFADKARAMLNYGCKQLGLQFGILSHIEQEQYAIKYAWSDDNSLTEGSRFELGDTYCRQTLMNKRVTSVTNAGATEWARHPCYEIFQQEAYIGTPVYVNDRLYGTLNFSSSSVRETAFSQSEHELVQLMAQWLGMELAHIQFEEQVLEQKNTISHILESTSEAFIAVDREQRILYANSLTRTLLNLESEPAPGSRLQDVVTELLRISGSALTNTIHHNLSYQFDLYYPASDKWLEASIHPTLQGASISLRDISERKHNAEILSHTLSIKNAILNSANFTIIATDIKGTIMSFNKAAERMLGYSAEEMIGKHTPTILHDPKEVALRAQTLSEEFGIRLEPSFEVFVAQARRGIPDEHEWNYIHKNGNRFPVLLSVTEMTDDHSECIGFLAIGVDITERKRIERIRDEFISTISHELRTPLTSIRGSLGLLAGDAAGELPKQAKSLVDIAGRNADRLLHLINDILDINKIESGKMSFKYEPLLLADFLQQAMEQNRSYADQFDVAFRLAAPIPEVSIYADEHRLMQVMMNLLSNAVKFSPEGSDIEIDAHIRQNFVRISVTDQGPGIPRAFQQKVFEKFTQADSSDSRNTGGTGLGMNIASAIVEQHGGKIGFTSQEGIGTTFYFDLPTCDSQAISRIKDQIFTTMPPRPCRLLICEDDHHIAGVMQLILIRYGCQSDIAYSADEAHQLLEHEHYDALLLDILLPDQHGLSLIKQLRRSADTRQLPIIVVSAIADLAHHQLDGGAADIIDWLDKPVDQERLIQAVRSALLRAPDKPRILHVEDDTDLQHVIRLMLEDQVELVSVTRLQQARAQLSRGQYDLVLLDVELPDGSGLELLEEIKDLPRPPATIIFSNNEPDGKYLEQVSAALLKSTTSRQTLMDTITAYLQQ